MNTIERNKKKLDTMSCEKALCMTQSHDLVNHKKTVMTQNGRQK